MVEHIWTVICSQSVVDRATNNISLQNILEQIDVFGPNFPAGGSIVVPVNIDLVTFWSRSIDNTPCKARARIQLIAPNNDILIMNEYEVDLTQHTRNRSIFKIRGLPIRGEGRHVFLVELYREDVWQPSVRVPLQIIHRLTPVIPPAEPTVGA